MLSWIFRALRLGGVLTSPQATPSGLQMTPPSLPGTENPRKPGSPDFILIVMSICLWLQPCALNGCKFERVIDGVDQTPYIFSGDVTLLCGEKCTVCVCKCYISIIYAGVMTYDKGLLQLSDTS